MAPVELEWSLNGFKQESVTAPDGQLAIINTPIGQAKAKVEKNGKGLFASPIIDRLGVFFPGDPEYLPYSTRGDGLHYHINSLFDFLIPKERKLRQAKKVWRKVERATPQGQIEIEATGT